MKRLLPVYLIILPTFLILRNTEGFLGLLVSVCDLTSIPAVDFDFGTQLQLSQEMLFQSDC